MRAETGVDAVKGFSSWKKLGSLLYSLCCMSEGKGGVCLRGKWVLFERKASDNQGWRCRANRQGDVSPTRVETEGWRGCIHFSVTMLIL